MNNRMKKIGDQFDKPLTNRELQIARLIAKGKKSDEIANELFISPHTVSTHRKKIHKKLKTHNTAELMNHLYSKKLMDF